MRTLISRLGVLLVAFPALMASASAESQKLTVDGVSIGYETKIFSEVGIEEKAAQPEPKSPFWEVNPARLVFPFHRQIGDKDWSAVQVIALVERAPNNLDKDFPDLMKRVASLRELLRERPKFPRTGPGTIPTVLNIDFGQQFVSKIRYVDFPWGSGIGFLTQGSQDNATYAVGARLYYQIEALSKDGTWGVSAQFRVNNSALPRTEDDEVLASTDDHYLTKMEDFLEDKPDKSFDPSLTAVQSIISSIHEEKDFSPADWASTFHGKKVTIQRTKNEPIAKKRH